MNTGIPDFAGPTRARAAAVPPAEEKTLEPRPEAPDADEGLLTNTLRLLNKIKRDTPLSPVERALVLGAKALFEELAEVCGDLLAPESASAAAAPTPSSPPLAAPNASARPASTTSEPTPAARSRSSRRTRPGETASNQ